MMKRANNISNMNRWLTLHSLIIIFIAFGASFFVEACAAHFAGNSVLQALPRALGTVIPVCALLTGYNLFMFRTSSRQVRLLSDCLEQIANGDFSVRIDTAKGKGLRTVFENVNVMAEELQQMELMKQDFINHFSHEFKTPISSIQGFAELILKTDVTDEDKQTYLSIIYEESSRLATLSESVLLLTKLDGQRIVGSKKTFRLDEQIRQCIVLLSKQWQSKKLEVSAELTETELYADEGLLKQIWTNLLSNAVKFTAEGGEITVTMQTNETAVSVTVADNGVGMSAEQTAKVFEKYYRAEQISTKGLGLGLPIVKRIAELNGGTISVRSEKGQGSAFTVTFFK